MNADGIDVVAEATKILKAPPLHVDQRRREAWWWCPFHNDAGRTGNTGKPNFSINIDTGEWNCFRCNNGGKTLHSLAKVLGAHWDPPENWKDTAAFQKQRAPSKVDCLNEALASARAAFLSSPALKYAEQRGTLHILLRFTALVTDNLSQRSAPIPGRWQMNPDC